MDVQSIINKYINNYNALDQTVKDDFYAQFIFAINQLDIISVMDMQVYLNNKIDYFNDRVSTLNNEIEQRKFEMVDDEELAASARGRKMTLGERFAELNEECGERIIEKDVCIDLISKLNMILLQIPSMILDKYNSMSPEDQNNLHSMLEQRSNDHKNRISTLNNEITQRKWELTDSEELESDARGRGISTVSLELELGWDIQEREIERKKLENMIKTYDNFYTMIQNSLVETGAKSR